MSKTWEVTWRQALRSGAFWAVEDSTGITAVYPEFNSAKKHAIMHWPKPHCVMTSANPPHNTEYDIQSVKTEKPLAKVRLVKVEELMSPDYKVEKIHRPNQE